MEKISLAILSLVISVLLVATAVSANTEITVQEIESILDQADRRMWLGLSDHGNTRALNEALQLVAKAEQNLASASLTANEKRELSLQIDALGEDLETLIELYEERFYGVFPLARMLITPPLVDEGLNITEQLHHPPDVAAVEIATRSFAKKLRHSSQPRVLIESESDYPGLENVAFQVLAQEGNSLPKNRRALVKALGADDLKKFDDNRSDPDLVDRLMTMFNTENLILMNLKRVSAANDDLVQYNIVADLYQRGETIKGSAVDASSVIRVDSYFATGHVRDRRDMFWPITLSQLLLLAAALFWSDRQNWGKENPPARSVKLSFGAALYFIGFAFAVISVTLLRRFAPEPNAMIAASWWWPALLGLQATVVGGLVAWIAQALLLELMSTVSNARSVGSLFALVAIGAAAYFVQPVLLLEGAQGFTTLIPFVLANISLAVLFGFAARTGPPVPHYFALGPLLLAPLLGVFLMMVSSRGLWLLAGASAVIWLLSIIRHRYTVAHGTEEPEPDVAEAAQTDQKRLLKVAKKLVKKNPLSSE